MKLIIAGSHDFTDDSYFRYAMTKLCSGNDQVEIICSTENRGISWVARGWAEEQAIPLTEFPIEPEKYGRRARFVSNEKMAEYGTDLLVFWDGKSRVTRHLINVSLKLGLDVQIYNLVVHLADSDEKDSAVN